MAQRTNKMIAARHTRFPWGENTRDVRNFTVEYRADCIIIILSPLSIVVTHRVSEMPFPNVSARDDRHSGSFADTRRCSAMQLHRPDPSVLRTPSTRGVVSFYATLRCFPTRLGKSSVVDFSRIPISIATYATCSERQRNDRQCVLLVQWREPSRARTSERETKPRRERERRRESEQDSQSGWSAARDRSRSVARQGVFSSRSRTSPISIMSAIACVDRSLWFQRCAREVGGTTPATMLPQTPDIIPTTLNQVSGGTKRAPVITDWRRHA